MKRRMEQCVVLSGYRPADARIEMSQTKNHLKPGDPVSGVAPTNLVLFSWLATFVAQHWY